MPRISMSRFTLSHVTLSHVMLSRFTLAHVTMLHVTMSRLVGRSLLGLIAAYRTVVSPWLPPRCRFAPSCSAYAAEAIRSHGPWLGLRLALARVARCHPWHAGGHDPVPPVVRERGPTSHAPPGHGHPGR